MRRRTPAGRITWSGGVALAIATAIGACVGQDPDLVPPTGDAGSGDPDAQGSTDGSPTNDGGSDADPGPPPVENATRWMQRFNAAAVRSMTTAPDGSTFLVGEFTAPVTLAPGVVLDNPTAEGQSTGQDVFVVKLKPDGAFDWVRGLGGTGYENAGAVTVEPTTGDVILTGAMTATFSLRVPGQPDLQVTLPSNTGRASFIVRLGALDGAARWATVVSGANSGTPGGSQLELRALAARGTTLAVAGYHQDGFTYPTANGTGQVPDDVPQFVASIALDTGKFNWLQGVTASTGSSSPVIAVADDGDVIVSGWTSSMADVAIGGKTKTALSEQWGWCARLAPDSGSARWLTGWGNVGTGLFGVNRVAIGKNRIGIAGVFSGSATFGGSANFRDAFLLSVDASNGDPKWHKVYGGSALDSANAIAIDRWDQIVVGVDYESADLSVEGKAMTPPLSPQPTSDSHAFAAKYDVDGKLLWLKNLFVASHPGPTNQPRVAFVGISPTPSGDLSAAVVGQGVLNLGASSQPTTLNASFEWFALRWTP